MGNLASVEREEGRRPTDPSSFCLDVLKFLPWQDRAKATQLHKRWRFLYNPTKNPEHARWCAQRLVAECGLYCPPKAPPGMNFVAIFEELWSRKSLFDASAEDAMVVGVDGRLLSVLDPRWSAAAAAATASRSSAQDSKEKDRYSITVSARFRPVSSSSSEKETNEEHQDRFVLPLHQRLQMIRMRDGVDRKAAMATLADEGSWFRVAWEKVAVDVATTAADDEEVEDDEQKEQEGTASATKDQSAADESKLADENKENGVAHIVMLTKTHSCAQSSVRSTNSNGGRVKSKRKRKPKLPRFAAKVLESLTAEARNGMAGGAGSSSSSSSSSVGGKEAMMTAAAMREKVHTVDPGTGRVLMIARGVGLRAFDFAHAMNDRTRQPWVYEAVSRRLVYDFLNGFNATIIVYGQTGSGKTHTMFGPPPPPPSKEELEEKKQEAEAKEESRWEEDQAKKAAEGRQEEMGEDKDREAKENEPERGAFRTRGLAEHERHWREMEEKALRAKAAREKREREEKKASDLARHRLRQRSMRRERGIVPRACEEIFACIRQRRAAGMRCDLTVSYVEIFGDEVIDLLRGGCRVGHSKVAAQRYVLSGAAALHAETLTDVEDFLAIGDAQKRRAATAMNERSSRAHALFILTLRSEKPAKSGGGGGSYGGDCKGSNVVKSSLFLADLGGSEQVKKSKVNEIFDDLGQGAVAEEEVDDEGDSAEDGTLLPSRRRRRRRRHRNHYVMSDRLREAVYINQGLLALKECIRALNEGADYVPYQNSKLTMLLSSALGGNSKAAVVVCASMEEKHASETIRALRFGEKCANVQNDAEAQTARLQLMLDQIDAEMERLEGTIRRKERWEMAEVVRTDELVEEGTLEAALGGREVVRTGKVVGAESERRELEELIRKRAALTGEDPELTLAEHGFGGGQFAKNAAGALSGNAAARFKSNDEDEGVKIKGKVVAKWVD